MPEYLARQIPKITGKWANRRSDSETAFEEITTLPPSGVLARLVHGESGDEIDNCGLFLEQRRRHIFFSGKLSMQQPEHARILPAQVQPLNFLGQPDEEHPSKHQP